MADSGDGDRDDPRSERPADGEERSGDDRGDRDGTDPTDGQPPGEDDDRRLESGPGSRGSSDRDDPGRERDPGHRDPADRDPRPAPEPADPYAGGRSESPTPAQAPGVEGESEGTAPASEADRRTRNVPDQESSEQPPLTESLLVFLKEVLSTVGAVVVVGAVLFAVSGVWPPLVAVESGSMEPHMYKGDLVFIVEDGRFAPADAEAGVVTHRQGEDTGYWSFGKPGNVVVYRPHQRVSPGEYEDTGGTPIIHRARFYVEEGEDWVAMADERYLGGVDSCNEVRSCPAPYDGFVTKGDNNARYDQVAGRSALVKPEWVRGVAKVRIPWLGCVRLQLSGDSCFR